MSYFGKLERFVIRLLNRSRLMRLRLSGATIGDGVRVFGRFTVLGDPRLLSIGRESTINEGVILNARESITIGERVHISCHTQLHTTFLKNTPGAQIHASLPIVIENDVWLASGVIVSAGSRIGAGTIVGANSVVINNIQPNVFAAGVPAVTVNSLENLITNM